MKKSRIYNILLLVITISVFFLAGEIILRITYPLKQNISFITTGATVQDTDFKKGSICMERDKDKDIKNFCDYADKKNDIFKFNIQKLPNVFRIITFGDSFTQGSGVENLEQTYPYQLEWILNENSKNLTYEVYNFGIAGVNTYQELLFLKKFGLQYHPDLLILQYYPNDAGPPTNLLNIKNVTFLLPYSKDFVFVDQELIPTILPLPINVNEVILENSHFLRFVSKRIDIIHQRVTKDGSEYKKWEELSYASLENIIEITKKENIPFIIIFVSGAVEQSCPHFLPIKLNVEEIALQNRAHFIDLCDYMNDFNLLEVKSKNDCGICDHYNEKGYGIMAEALFEKIRDLGFV